jgi:hypothetical protein
MILKRIFEYLLFLLFKFGNKALQTEKHEFLDKVQTSSSHNTAFNMRQVLTGDNHKGMIMRPNSNSHAS